MCSFISFIVPFFTGIVVVTTETTSHPVVRKVQDVKSATAVEEARMFTMPLCIIYFFARIKSAFTAGSDGFTPTPVFPFIVFMDPKRALVPLRKTPIPHFPSDYKAIFLR